jgi:superfamily I DNA and/or RNA helicase
VPPAAAAAAAQVATVDSFQGAERDVIILATTISSPWDFVGDPHRLCVALTRGKRHLLVLGSSRALERTSPVYKRIIGACQQQAGQYFVGHGLLGHLRACGGAV